MNVAHKIKQMPFEAVALIVAKDDNFKRSVLKYLWENEVEAMLTSNLIEAQKMVAQYQPDFVFIPYDHPSYTKVAAFAHKFNKLKSTQFIAYAETDVSNPIPRLSLFSTKRNIHPPLTGERLLYHMKAIFNNTKDYHIIREQKKLLVNSIKNKFPLDPSILDVAMEKALTAVSEPNMETSPKRIEVTTRVNCIPFDTDFYKGFLVGVQGESPEDEIKFFHNFQRSLIDFLREKGVTLPFSKFKQLKIEKTHFNKWIKSKASIFKMSFHKNYETSLAFFKTTPEAMNPIGPVQKQMAPIKVSHIKTNSSLPVNLYNYSKAANNFTVYLKKGTPFEKQEIKKLTTTNVKYLYINEKDLPDFYDFIMFNFIKNCVEEYNEEIRALELAEHNRMSDELEMVKVIQDALFPESYYEDDFIKIKGNYRTSSECGGDWWHYNVTKDKVYLWIGDATGHGVSAALVTSAAKACSCLIYHFPEMSLKELTSIINHAVFGTSKGKIQMTFFLACIELKTGVMKICNSGHESPMVFPFKERLNKKDIRSLCGKLNPRLGEDLSNTFKEDQTIIHVGDRLFFYTDGIPELVNDSGTQWSEQKMTRLLIRNFQKGPGIELAMTNLESGIEDFRAGTPLADDITYFMVEFKKLKK